MDNDNLKNAYDSLQRKELEQRKTIKQMSERIKELEALVSKNESLQLISVPLLDHYEGELNTERIKAYRFEAEKWNLHEDSIGKIFCAGADWYKSKCNER